MKNKSPVKRGFNCYLLQMATGGKITQYFGS